MCLPFSPRDTVLNMGSAYQRGSPLSGVKILDVGCGGGLLSEVRNGTLLFFLFRSTCIVWVSCDALPFLVLGGGALLLQGYVSSTASTGS